jgi:hypothetical protein
MKNIIAIHDPEEIHTYVRDLWRTDLFRDSQDDENGYIRGIVDDLAQRPVVFFEMDDPSIEWSQFTTWMGAYALRPDYDSDAIHDLYYLHEFVHGATMEYDTGLSFVDWHRKMCENEMLASVHSEALVYFQLKGLRDLSFDFDIWVDRYLKDRGKLHPYGATMTSWRRVDGNISVHGFTHHNTKEALLKARKESMTTPDPFDFLEMQLHYYAMQNVQWSNIWKDHFREVEEHMASYLKLAEEDRAAALEMHVGWLRDMRNPDPLLHNQVTPYEREAIAFAKIVEANKKRQGNQILKA